MQRTLFKMQRRSLTIAILFFVLVFASLTAIDLLKYQHDERERVKRDTQDLAEEIDRAFSRVSAAFSALDSVSLRCDSHTLTAMRAQQFDLSFVSELGLSSYSGQLLCTSWQKLTETIQVQRPPPPGQVRIFGPILTRYLGKPALVLSKGRTDGSEINALIPSHWLNEALRQFNHEDGYQAVIHTDSGTPIVLEGRYTLPLAPHIDFPLRHSLVYEGLADTLERHYIVIERVKHWPLAVINARTTAAMDAGGLQLRLANVGIAFIFALIVYASIMRVQKRDIGLVQQIEKGILKNEFVNHYQPIIDAHTQQITSLEVLVRWQHPVDGLIPPGMFIPEAERSGLIIPLTSLIINNTISELSAILYGHPKLKININICGQHLMDKPFIQEVINSQKAIPNLMLELTENEVVAHKDEHIIEAVNALRGANIGLAIDDFGTGYSGLQYLGELPIDCIKIDRSFVAACGTDSPNAVVLETVANMAAKLQKSTVAEGVETQEQADYLISKHVYLHQGWLYAKAMPIDELVSFIRDRNQSGSPALAVTR